MDKNQDNEEEFQFTEEEEEGQKYQSPASASPVMAEDNSARRKKLILLIAGIVVVLFIVYKLYGLFTAGPAKVALTPPSVPKPAVAAMPVAAAPAPAPAISSTKPEEGDVLGKKVSGLEQAVVQVGQTQENLQNQIAGLSSAVSEIQNNLALMSQKITDLSQKKPAEKAKKTIEHKPVKKVVKKMPVSPASTYYVKALIQGRAWLQSNNGATFTVGVGDSLAGYGIVQNIDANSGTVTTSSGKIIGFMPLDR